MGTKMGPGYACPFMGHLEQKLLQHYSKPVPEMYKKYIDNGIGATSMSHSQLLDFIEFVQNFHPPVKLTYEIFEQSVACLNMDISLKYRKLTKPAHYKATDSHSYLDYRSSHNPSTQKNSIPSSQFLRLCYLWSDDTDFEKKRAEEMVEFFNQRHYPEDIVRTALQKVKTIPRQQTLQPNDKTATEKRPVISLLYHPSTNLVRKIIQSNWSLFVIMRRISSDLQSAATDRIQTRHQHP